MPIKSVDAQTLKSWLANDEVIIVDVREPAEHAAENIPGATLIPLGKISKAVLPKSKGKKLVIHCRSGGRSSNACTKLLAEDPNLELYNLEGGITAWNQLDGAIDTNASSKRFLPLERQVQFGIGVLVLIATLLSWLVSPWFLLLNAFFGAGLIYASLTGFCGLALFLAKMPWNQKAGKTEQCCITSK